MANAEQREQESRVGYVAPAVVLETKLEVRAGSTLSVPDTLQGLMGGNVK
jgi:hypothetical protein